jgi:hypothetical protein
MLRALVAGIKCGQAQPSLSGSLECSAEDEHFHHDFLLYFLDVIRFLADGWHRKLRSTCTIDQAVPRKESGQSLLLHFLSQAEWAHVRPDFFT